MGCNSILVGVDINLMDLNMMSLAFDVILMGFDMILNVGGCYDFEYGL